MTRATGQKPPDPSDPLELVGVAMAGGPEDETAFAEMALSLADEFLRIGCMPEQVMQIFRDPFYRMTHAVWRAWGEQRVRDMVEGLAQRYVRA